MNGLHSRRPGFRSTCALAATVALLSGCSGSDSGADSNSEGGVTAAGGATAGGATSGGATATGGANASGGTTAANGGSAASGGTTNSGSGGASSGGTSMGAGGTSGSSAGGVNGVGGKAAGGGNAMGGKAAGSGGTESGAGGKASGGAVNGGANGGSKASGGAAGSAGNAGSGGMTNCPFTGHVTYTLSKSANPTQEEQNAYTLITKAMDKAISYYNCYTDITKSITASYVPSVQTADGNSNGSLRFGSNTTYMDYRTAMHEISHTVGIGTASNWGSFVSNGLFTGTNAKMQLDAINATLTTPLYTDVHADTQHFWPYGLNQQSEVKSEADLLFHCKMVMAIRKDLGLK